MSITGVSDTAYAGATTAREKAKNSTAATAFADMLAQAGKTEEAKPILTPEELAEEKEKQRIRDLLNSMLTGTESPYAGKSVDELNAGLDEAYDDLGQDIATLADKHGIDHVSVMNGGILIRIPSPIDTSKYFVQSGSDGRMIFNGSGYQAEVDRLKEQGVWDDMLAKCFKQAEDFFKEYRESQRNWNAIRDELAVRSAVVKAADSIPGFEEEYMADPEGTINKHFEALQEDFKGVTVSYIDGEVRYKR